MTANDWRAECAFIGDVQWDHPSFNGDPAVFLRYCEMQRNAASRDGFHDSAQYIQHVMDDVIAAQEETNA